MGKKVKILLILILIMSAGLRFFYLERIPAGLLPEEVSNGWNAYSILKTSKDEWGNFLPLIFRESGGYKLPLASYITVASEAVLGLSELAVRLPTAVAGILSVLLTYLVTFEIFRKKKIALLAAFFLSLSPWHMSFSRYGMEINIGLPLFLAGLFFLLKAKKQIIWFLISGLFFGLSYYSYYSYTVFTLLFILGLLFLWKELFFAPKNRYITLCFILIQVLFLSPFIINKQLSKRYNQVSFTQDIGIVNRINEHRQACNQQSPPLLCKVVYNQPLFFFIDKIRNYINHFSTTTFFLYGSQLGLSSMPDRWGLLYLFEFPLILIGIIALIRKNAFPKILGLWLVIFAVPSSLASEGHIWRMATILPLPQMITAAGLIELLRLNRNKLVKISVTGIICFSLLLFLADYFIYFPFAQGAYSYSGFKELYRYLKGIEHNYDYIVIAPTSLGLDQLYIYYLFYNQYNPQVYQLGKEVERTVSEQNWVHVGRIGKWYFISNPHQTLWPMTNKTLFITDGSYKEKTIELNDSLIPKLLHTVSYANGNVAFKIIELNN